MSGWLERRRLPIGASRGRKGPTGSGTPGGGGNSGKPGGGDGGGGRGGGRGRGGGGKSLTLVDSVGPIGWSGATNLGTRIFGAEAPDRLVILALSWGRVGLTRDITAVSLGGVAATLLRQQDLGSQTENAEIWGALVPSNASQNVTITWDDTGGASSSAALKLFRVTGCSLTPEATGAAAGVASSISPGLTGVSNGSIIISTAVTNDNDGFTYSCDGNFGTKDTLDGGEENFFGWSWGIKDGAGNISETYRSTVGSVVHRGVAVALA